MNKKLSLELEGAEEHQHCVVSVEIDFDSDPDLCTFEIIEISGNYLPERWEITSAIWKHFNHPERMD